MVATDKAKIWVHSDFEYLLRNGHQKFNEILTEKYGRDMSFIDYTKMLADIMGATVILPLPKESLQPMKKTKHSNKITFHFGEK